MNNVVELYFIAKLATLLTQKWTDTNAYKLGIIDKDGKPLKKSTQLRTAQEKAAYSSIDRFAFNLRRLIETLPGGKSKIVKYLAVYALFKEESETPLDVAFMEQFSNINNEFQEFLTESDGNNEDLQET